MKSHQPDKSKEKSSSASVDLFMEGLGGEIRPDQAAEAAFAAVRAKHIRKAEPARTRKSPPKAQE